MGTKTTHYDVAEFLETPAEMAAYLEACIQESEGDAVFIAKALGDIARAKGMTQITRESMDCRVKAYTRHSLVIGTQVLTLHSRNLSPEAQIEHLCVRKA